MVLNIQGLPIKMVISSKRDHTFWIIKGIIVAVTWVNHVIAVTIRIGLNGHKSLKGYTA